MGISFQMIALRPSSQHRAAPAAKAIAVLTAAAVVCSTLPVRAQEGGLPIIRDAETRFPESWELVKGESDILRELGGPAAALRPAETFATGHWWQSGIFSLHNVFPCVRRSKCASLSFST